MLSLEALREELEALTPHVEEADADILVALEVKNAATAAYEESKVEVRRLKAIRDPLREQQMLLQRVIGDIDPDTPPSIVLSGAAPEEIVDADVQTITSDDVAHVDAAVDAADLGGE